MFRKILFTTIIQIYILINLGFSFQTILTIKETGGINRTNYPLTFGIPIKKGDAFSDQGFQIIGYSAQFKTLSKWNDGSIRWLLCDTQISISANGTVILLLTDGSGNSSKTNLSYTQNGNIINIETGRIKFSINANNFNLFDELWYDKDENKVYDENEKIISASSTNGFVVSKDNNKYFSSKCNNSKIEIEEEGPMRIVVKVCGQHWDNAQQRMLDYTTRIHAYNNQSFVKIAYTFYNKQSTKLGGEWGNPPPESYIDVADISIETKVNLQSSSLNYAIGGEENNIYHGILNTGESIYIYGNGSNTPDDINYTINGNINAIKKRAIGFGELDNSDIGITVAIRNFWQLFPKAIQLNADGKISIKLIPEYYHAQGDFTDPNKVYCGAAKTHDVLIYFHNGDYNDAHSQDIVKAFNNPLFAVADPEYYVSTEVLGNFPVADLSVYQDKYLPQVQLYEQKFIEIYNTVISYRESSRWTGKNEYGMWNFGDSWQDQWSNMQYDLPHSLYIQFMRTGNLDYFKLANEEVEHYQDVDIIHWIGVTTAGSLKEAFLGSARRLPNINHGLGYDYGYMGDISTKGPGMVLHYFFTGDRQSLDIAKLHADYVINSHLKYDKDYLLYGPRRLGLGLQAVLFYYQASGDQSYLNNGNYYIGNMDGNLKSSAYTLAYKAIEFQKISPKYPEIWEKWKNYNINCDDGFRFADANGAGASWQSGIAWEGMRLYYEETGDTLVKNFIIKGVKWLTDTTRSDLWNGTYFWGYEPSIYPSGDEQGQNGAGELASSLTFAYKYTGDISLINKALSALNYSLVGGGANATIDPKIFALKTKTVPYLLYFLTKTKKKIEPLIKSIVPDTIYDGLNNIKILGSNFSNVSDSVKLELCNSEFYDSSSIKIRQSIENTYDEIIYFTCNQNSLTMGKVFTFITNNIGLRNEKGFPIYLKSMSTISNEANSSYPKNFFLSQNYPNPFNKTTIITFGIPASIADQKNKISVRTSLKIYNISGQVVRTLIDEIKNSGYYKIVWDGKDENGNDVASGNYVYKLMVGYVTLSKKLTLLN